MLTITENETIWKEELTDKNYCAYFAQMEVKHGGRIQKEKQLSKTNVRCKRDVKMSMIELVFKYFIRRFIQ